MRKLWDDFVRAPLSGTLVGMSALAAILWMLNGDMVLAVLWLLVCGQASDRRRLYLKELDVDE